jgi:hypothetical protein
MIRTTAFLTLALLLAGCSRYHSRAQGPFDKPPKAPPPPYGAVAPMTANRPIANQSPLGIASADPAPPLPPEEPSLIPPKSSGIPPAPAAVDANASGFPPFKRRPEPKPGELPSPFAPKEMPSTPAQPAAPNAKNLAELKTLLATANAVWRATDTFEGVLTRREINPKGQLNSEVLVFQYRREPMSVFTRNIGGSGKGRELVYNPGKFGDKMYVMLGEGDSKLAKAGFIAPAISPDDSRATEKARYSIREAGFSRNANVLGAAIAKIADGKAPADSLVYEGEVTRPEYLHPLVGITYKMRPGDDPLMPAGGTRFYYFDMKKDSPSYGMPVLVIATDAMGKEVEYYLFDKIKSPAGLTDADFDPARLGKKK